MSCALLKGRAILAFALLLAGCSTAPAEHSTTRASLFDDGLFAAPSEHIASDHLFDLSDEMRAYLRIDILGTTHDKDTRRALYQALYSKRQLKLEYDSSKTRNAAEAFHERAGNCLSLVLLTAAFAKELGLFVQFESVFSDQAISRSGDIIYVSDHVNLTLGRRHDVGDIVYQLSDPMTIDFLPAKDMAGRRARVIREETVVAMYLNNRAAEAIAAGRLDDAYWWAHKAIDVDPTFLNSYNTLGVVYRRHGNLREAAHVLELAMELEPSNTTPMSTMVLVLNALGRYTEAAALTTRLRQTQLYPPFFFYDKGVEAMKAKDYATARELFATEVARAAYYHEFHAWLAAAYVGLGDLAQARKHLAIAIDTSTSPTIRATYVARLDELKEIKLEQRIPARSN